MRDPQDNAASTVIGAIVVLAIIGIAIVYVNAFHVPQQGVGNEIIAREQAERSLARLASDLDVAQTSAITADLPLEAPAAPPPLMSGLILTPARAPGRIAFEPSQTNITISTTIATPPGGVAPGDPTRVDLGADRARIYQLGNATAGAPAGALQVSVGGAYLDAATYSLSAGGVFLDRPAGSSLVASPALRVAAGNVAGLPTTMLSWRVPILAGVAGEAFGATAAQAGFLPGLVASSGGGERVFNVTIVIQTNTLLAWKTALEQAVGSKGVVTTIPGSDPDSGVVTATILPPPGTPASTPAVQLFLESVRYDVEVTARNAR